MEVLPQLSQPTATPLARSTQPLLPFHASKKKINNTIFSAKLETKDKDDHYYREAMKRACLHPMFTDPYIRCLLPPIIETEQAQILNKHCLATKFIDDKLVKTMQKIDAFRQVVLLSDGMDTRPYRLNWPLSTILFDVSLDRFYKTSTKKLEGVGAKIPRGCLFFHVPSETPNIQQALRIKGFNGARPSLWVLQGLPVSSLASFKDILCVVSNLAMKGSIFLGELADDWLFETETGIKSTIMECMDKLFMSHGLRVEMIGYDEVAGNIGKESVKDGRENILFVAEQLQFSDDQMELWRREFQRLEEDGDEEGFEEL
ncbi:S-adenosyl-L-methionine-dependentmethyltransferases superfamily protein [Striga asiatica]|uniref:S-adenosyl-L-methionine-dependentmethyltransferases superfamily protein n=1 Tax=Striga asiatica TaxID=4170 RepID=A0A5A7PQF7_STRAF|nr:S-adenosyl-L-methionine-dependentmethyltransferases superfamily protein [Striga asiatica]